MPKIKVLLLLALLGSLATSLSVSSVTLQNAATTTALQGSIMGGTKLYISGLGFSSVMTDNTVLVGQYPCTLLDGATDVSLVCQTTYPGVNQQQWGLNIIVMVSGQGAYVAPQTFSYTNGQTPYLYAVSPSISYGGAGTLLNFLGIHRIFDLGSDIFQGSVYKMLVGDSICSRFGLYQAQINPNGLANIQCYQSYQQEAGKYNVTEWLFPGFSDSYQLTYKASLDNNDIFQFVALPLVNATTHSGSIAGQTLTIGGTGFSLNTSQMSASVDGVNCKIISSNYFSVTCNLDPKVSQSAQLPTNAATPNNSYISGSGFLYQRYDMTSISGASLSKFKGLLDNKTMTAYLIEQSVRGQIKSIDVYGSNYAQVWKGYFTPNVTGNYTFRGVADDQFAVYFSNLTYGSTVSFANSTPLIYSYTYTPSNVFSNYYLTDYLNHASGPILLTKGQSYYMEAYHYNGGGSGDFSLSVQVPNNDNTVNYWQTYEVHTITTNLTSQPEILSFVSQGVSTGTYMLKILEVDPISLVATVNQNVSGIPWNANSSTFCSSIGQMTGFSGYSILCSLAMSNADGPTTNITIARIFNYTVTINGYRSDADRAHQMKATYTATGGSFTNSTLQSHSPVMNGTFSLTLNGTSINIFNSTTSDYSNPNIPYNVDIYTLANAFRALPGLQWVEVQSTGNTQISNKWIIYYIGYNQDLPDLVSSNAGLTGGIPGTIPTVTTATRRNYTSDLFVDPIDYRWMSTCSSKPNVLVTVNNIPSACNTDCTYTFNNVVPALTTASLPSTSNVLSLTLTDPASTNTPLASITVTLDNQPCVNLTGTMTNFTCKLPNNTDNTAIITAGSHTPVVYINNIGFAAIDPSLTPVVVSLSLTSVTNPSGGVNGGYSATIIGTGFPADISTINFTLCNQQASISSLTNIQAIVNVPQCGTTAVTQNIVANFNSLTSNNLPFSYTTTSSAVTITAISPTSWSPVLKGVLNITGTSFGTNASLLTTYLTNGSGNVYQMKILNLTDTFLQVGIPGGLPGNFNVSVIKSGFGNAIAVPETANDFVYEVVVDSISPTNGSIAGGTLITITGRNFVADTLDTMVTIGDQLNQLCNIQFINTTQIKCRTPPKNFYYNVSVPQIVLVNSKLRIDSTCSQPSCTFTFIDQASSPNLTSISSTSISAGNVLILTGLNFNVGASYATSVTNLISGKVTSVAATSSNATSITCTFPNVEAGYYQVKARADPIGQSYGLPIIVNLNLNSVAPYALSVNGGQVVIAGSGFPETWPNQYYNQLSFATGKQNLPLNFLSMNTTQLVLQVPPGVNGRQFTFSITSPVTTASGAPITKNLGFSQQSSSTPTVNLISTATLSPNTATTVTLNRTILNTATPNIIYIYSVSNPAFTYNISSWSYNGTSITFSVTLNSGKYGFKLFNTAYGWYSTSSNSYLSVSSSGTYSASATPASFNGGLFTVTGNNIGDGATITVNGFVGTVQSRTPTQASFNVPQLINPLSQANFTLAKNVTLNLTQYNTWGDASGWNSAFDNNYQTIYSSSNAVCNVGVDFGVGLGVQITRLRIFPNPAWQVAYKYILGASIQVSNDNITWSTLATVDQTIHAGWNSYMITNTNTFRYVKFAHTSVSMCQIAELSITGIVMSSVPISSIVSFSSNVTFNDGLSTQTFTNGIEYRQDHTPLVTAINPPNGDVFGGYNISLTGVYFNLGTPTVNIDNVDCPVQSSNATNIICTVGSRLTLPNAITFTVMIGSIPAITQKSFRYVLRWSDPRTWGTDLPPIADDLVYVPPNMHLLVDQSTPVLNSIIVENATIEFSDEKDMTIQTGIITLRGGQFIAGTEQSPYQHQLTFIMHGNYYGVQQPIFGNKGIGCLQCQFSMIGKKRTPTWTMISATINAGENQFSTVEPTDWKVGETIVVAATNYNHNEAQQKNILLVINSTTFLVDSPFKYEHLSVQQNYTADDTITMRAEVALLTRNIKMMGDSDSYATQYGSHLLLAGSAENGLNGKIAYTQFTNCGQPQILGRYCHHFHMNGDVPESYSIGNSVHQSFARVLTLHGVHFLYVAWDVGYRVKGHNFFIEDGIETNNVLQHNLAIGSLQVDNMLQTDISVASFWVTNPSNHLRNNHAAGSDFYGFWYQIKAHPDGPSATLDICPIGNPLGESHDNVAHSNNRFGLRIFQLYARTYPCDPIRDDTLLDPWSNNPSIQSVFSNYTIYKSGRSGVLAQQTGNMIFQNFTIVESIHSSMQFYKTNFTKESVQVVGLISVGRSDLNSPPNDTYLNSSFGIILSRTGIMEVHNIRFYNYLPSMTVWQACSQCDNVLLYTNFGATYYASQIQYNNIQGPYFNMLGLKRQVFYDNDGTLTAGFDGNTRKSATLTYGWPHLLQEQNYCANSTSPGLWDNGAVCDGNVTIRSVMFTNTMPQQTFKSQNLKARQLDNIENITQYNQTYYTSVLSLQKNMQPQIQMKFTFSLPYITGRTYNIWWGTGIDFDHLAMVTHQLYKATQAGMIFKFNYTLGRQLYEIAPLRQGHSFNYSLLKFQTANYLDSKTCGNGDYYHNNANPAGYRFLELCASGKNRTMFQYIDVNAIYCRYLCPAPPGSCTKQSFVRLWSNATQWPGGVMPSNGDDLIIPCNWTLKVDMQPAVIGYFEISGTVIIQDTLNINITADNIWIKGGTVTIGSSSKPITNYQVVIQLNGVHNGTGFVVSPDLEGNKMLAVTGELQMYGAAPATIWTVLTAFANPGDTSIKVQSTAGWKVGDQIGIAPSFNGQTEFEKVTITAINSNNVSFTPALQYAHFGDTVPTIQKSFGTMDMRAGVGHLTRNIKIAAGPDSGFGFTVVQAGYSQIIDGVNVIHTGNMTTVGVQFINGGQYDTAQAALQIQNIRTQTSHTLITQSSFHDCQDFCMNINNAFDIQVTNNVFFHARKYHVIALTMYNFNFTNNLLIGVTKRPTMTMNDLIACFASWQVVNPVTDNVLVTNNLCQGSQGNGFIVPHVSCSQIDKFPFAGNTAGSCDIGWIISRGTSDTCVALKGLYAYSSNIGQIHNPANSVQSHFKNFIMAQNGRSITIRLGGDSPDKTGYLNDSYITAIARPNCTNCYGTGRSDCIGNHGMRMITTGANGEELPNKFGAGYDVVCTAETIDGKSFIYNVEFNNFNQTYPLLPQCSNNVVFKPHDGAVDITGSQHLFNTTCTQCQLQAFAFFTPNKASELGWLGGCGTMLCTGRDNYVIQDHDGKFLPSKGILLANNTWVGDNTPSCTPIPAINGHYCTSEDFAVLEYESIAPDFNTRVMWPVNLTFDGGNWTSLTNGWKQWMWQGGQPQNKRLGRFVSVLPLGKMYNMSFTAMPPQDMTFKIQKRLPQGNSSDWVIVKIFYPQPYTINVGVNGNLVNPIALLDNNGQSPLNTSQCGSNKFFYKNYTIHFVVTGDANCLVRVTVSNSIQLTARFDMAASDFFSNNGVTRFINRMAALLQISDTSRIKVVGVYTGSIDVAVIIIPVITPIAASNTTNMTGQYLDMTALQQIINTMITNGTFATQMSNGGIGTLLSAQTIIIGTNPSASASTDPVNRTGLIIGIVLGATFILCLVIVGSVCYMRKRAKITQIVSEQIPAQSESHKDDLPKLVSNDNFSLVDLQGHKKELY